MLVGITVGEFVFSLDHQVESSSIYYCSKRLTDLTRNITLTFML